MKWSMLAPAAILGLGAALTNGIRHQVTMQPRAPMKAIPASMEGFAGKELIVPDEERRIAGMSDYAMRAFGPDSSPLFTFYVGYYDRQVQGRSIHSPKNCLPGAGWEILNANRLATSTPSGAGTVNRVLLANRSARALVYYWYQGRGRVEASEYKVKWNLLRDAALHGRTEEALVRLVLPLESSPSRSMAESEREADARAKRLIATALAAVDNVLPTAPQ